MKKMTALSMLSVLALAAPLASAADSGWYAGAGGGGTNFKGDEVDLQPSLANEVYTLTKLDDSSMGWKLFVGKQLHENFAVELAYTDMGKFSYDANIITSPYAPTTESGTAKPACWSLSAVGILPVGNNFSLLGKAGLCRWDDRVWAQEVGGPPYPEESIGNSLTFGLGAKYDFSTNWGVRAEWERFNNVVHHRDRADVDLWSVSLQYGF